MKLRFAALILAIMAWAAPLAAQTISSTTYPFSSAGSVALEDLSSGTTPLLGANLDDNASAVMPIGFDFWFVGARYTQFSVNANGLLRLGASAVGTTFSNNLTSSANVPQIAPYWDDLWIGTNGKVHFKVVGSVPDRKLVVEWSNMQVPRVGTGNAGAATFQCWLHESTGRIEFVYGSGMAPNAANGGVSVGFGSSASTFASVSVAGTTVAYGSANNANVAAIAAGTKYSFVPQVPAGPSDLSFSGVSALGMTLHWTDNATNEVGYALYRSSDDVSYTFVGQTAANATSSVQTGLTPSSPYFWQVRAVTEGALSAALAGNQSTTAPGSVVSSGSGNWSSTIPDAPWPGGLVPSAQDQVTIADGHEVIVDVAASCYQLSVGQGNSGTLRFEDVSARTLTVTSDLTISSGGVLSSGVGGVQTGHVLAVGGQLVNDGSLDLSTNSNQAGATLVFTGPSSASLSGTGAVTNLRSLTVNKGNSFTSTLTLSPATLTIQGAAALAPAFATLTNGTLHVAGSFALSSAVFGSPAYSVGATAGLWLDNPNVQVLPQAGSPSIRGLLRVSAGSYEVGAAADQSLSIFSGSTVQIEGGAVRVAGRCAVNSSNSAVTYLQTGGIVTVNTAGHTSTTFATFDLGTAPALVSISGGTIVLQGVNGAGSGPRDYRNQGGVQNVVGGTLQLGNAETGASKIFWVGGIAPGLRVTAISAGHAAQLTGTLTAGGSSFVESGATLNLNGFRLTQSGGDLVDDGLITGLSGNSELYFTGATPQTFSGTGSVAAPLPKLSVDNPAGLTIDPGLPANIVARRVQLIRGVLHNSSRVTLGFSDSIVAVTQIGAASSSEEGGAYDSAPTFSPGTGGLSVVYLQEAGARSTGYEIPSARTLNNLTLDNTNGVDLSGGALTLTSSLTLTNGTLRSSSANLLTLANSISTPPSGSVASYVDGPLAIQFQVNSATTRTFAIGKALAFRPLVLKSVNTSNVSRVFTAEVIPGSTGGTPTAPLQALTVARYWRVANSSFLNAAARVNLAFGVDDNVGALANARVAQSSSSSGSYLNLGGSTTGSQSAGTVESTSNLTAGSDYFAIGSTGSLASSWDGGAGTNHWSDPANWSPDGVPGAATDVSLSSLAPTTIVVDGGFSLGNLVVASNIDLQIASGTLTVSSSFTQTGGAVSLGSGAISVGATGNLSGGSLATSGGTFTISGAATVSGATLNLSGTGRLVAASTLTLSSGSVSLGSGTLEVRGAFSKTGGAFASGTGTVLFSGTATQNIGGGVAYYDLVLRNGGAGKPKRLTAEASYVVNNDLVVESTSQLALSSSNETFLTVWGSLRYSGVAGGANLGSLKLLLSGSGKTIEASGVAPVILTTSSSLDRERPEPPAVRKRFLTDPAAGRWIANENGGKPTLLLENTFDQRRGEVEAWLERQDPSATVVIDLDDRTIVRNAATVSTLEASASALEMQVFVSSGADYALGGSLSMASGRVLTVSGRLDAGSFTIGGAGGLSVGSSGTLATMVNSPSGLSAAVVTSGANSYSGGAIIDYEATGDQVINATSHPAAAMIHTSGSGTKTLSADLTITGSSGPLLDQGAILVGPGTTFADGGHRIHFTTPQFANVVVHGVYQSAPGGGLSYEAGAFDSNVLADDGTVFGDLSINFNDSNFPVELNSSSVSNIRFRNVVFGGTDGSGTAGGTLRLNETGITSVTVTGNVTLAPVATSNSGGGFGGTLGKTGLVTLQGHLSSTSTSPTQPLMNANGTNTLALNGTGPQTLTLASDATSFSGATLALSNAAGLVLGGNAKTLAIGAGGTIALGGANVTTGTNTLALAAGAGLTRTTGRVIGKLTKAVPTGAPTVAFEIGSATDDDPVSVSFAQVTGAGSLTASTTAGDHPEVATSGIDSGKSLNRHYTLISQGVSFDSCAASFGFPAVEVDPAADLDHFLVRKKESGEWSSVARGAHTPTSIDAHGITSFGDFVFGEGLYYDVQASAGEGGGVTPNGPIPVLAGTSQTFSIVAGPCHHVTEVLVDGVSVGTVSSYTFDDVAAPHTISASFAVDTHSIEALAGSGGSISPTGTLTASCGDSPSFAIAPNVGYHVVDVLVDGASVGPVTTYGFTSVAAAHTISASFAIDTFDITASAGSHGSITPEGVLSLPYGASQSFTVAPATGYEIADVLVDGASVGPVASYTFTNVVAGHTIIASFAPVAAVVSVASPSIVIGPANPCVSVPVAIDRSSAEPMLGYSVTFALSGGLVLCAGTGSVSEGPYLSGAGATSFQVTDLGSGSYRVDAEVAVEACGPTGPNGTLFSVGVSSAAPGGNGTLSITAVSARRCNGNPLSASGSDPATIAIDNTAPQAAVLLPNGGESWPMGSSQSITWSATDAGGVTAVDLSYSTDGGLTFPHDIAQSVANTGAYPWTVPAVASSTVRVRVTARDAAGNATGDDSDGDFTIRPYFVTASAGAGGSIDPSGAVAVNVSADQSFTITPDPAHHVLDVLVDGVSVGAVNSYTFTNVGADHSIAATFAIDTHVVTATTGDHGTIAPSGPIVVEDGADQAFAMTPSACYDVADVLVDGLSVGAVSSYTFHGIIADHTIAASFALRTHVITAAAGAHGTIDPAGDATVSCGADQVFTLTPETGYHVADVLVDGISVGAVTGYTFTDVMAGHSIAATFAIDQFTITATAGLHGSVTPAGSTTVPYGDNQTFEIAAEPGFFIADVLVDGASVGSLTSYTFFSVSSDHTIAASFAVITYTLTASAGAHGSIVPAGESIMPQGSNLSYTLTADPGYHVMDVLVDGVSVGAVTSYSFNNVTADHSIAAAFAINPVVPAMTTLSALPLKSGNDADGTTRVRLTWSDAPPAAAVAVYRAPYASYPEYAGGAPVVPVYPPPAPWVATAVTQSEDIDEVTSRGFYSYVAFATDGYGTVSAASNMTTGTLNYWLGDVSDGVLAGQGDNVIGTEDLALLAAHYGITGAAVAPFAYLDVGPTTDGTIDGRPIPDDALEFEDLLLFSINSNPGPPVAPSSASDQLSLTALVSVTLAQEFDASLSLQGTGNVQTISIALSWNPAVVEPISASGDPAFTTAGLVLSPIAGTLDAALVGAHSGGIAGAIGAIRFRAIAAGNPSIHVGLIRARDSGNVPVTVTAAPPVGVAIVPSVTRFARATPNPFSAATTLQLSLAKAGPVELVVFGVDGRKIRTLLSGFEPAGTLHVAWEGCDDRGARVPAGTYYVRFKAGDARFTRTVVRLR